MKPTALLRCNSSVFARHPAVAYLSLVRPMDPSPAPLRADALPYIERLIDAWCERRAIGPLRWILSGAYPGLYHTDRWLTVLDALKTIKGLCHEQLTPGEKGLASGRAWDTARDL